MKHKKQFRTRTSGTLSQIGKVFPMQGSRHSLKPICLPKHAVRTVQQLPMALVRTRLRSGIAGYDKQGKRIFVDRSVMQKDVMPLVTHESVEYHLMHHEGYPYDMAHTIATEEERRAVESNGRDWEKYSQRMIHLASAILKRKDARDPPDMYSGSKYKRIWKIQLANRYL